MAQGSLFYIDIYMILEDLKLHDVQVSAIGPMVHLFEILSANKIKTLFTRNSKHVLATSLINVCYLPGALSMHLICFPSVWMIRLIN